MDDNRPGRPGDEDEDEEFNDALDDLFGEPVETTRQTAPDTTRQTAPGTGYVPPPPGPQPHPDSQWTKPPPAREGTTFAAVTRFAVIGCVAIIALSVICVIALAVIGILFGDPDATTSVVMFPVM